MLSVGDFLYNQRANRICFRVIYESNTHNYWKIRDLQTSVCNVIPKKSWERWEDLSWIALEQNDLLNILYGEIE